MPVLLLADDTMVLSPFLAFLSCGHIAGSERINISSEA